MVGINEMKTLIGAAKNAKQIAKEDAYRQKMLVELLSYLNLKF